MTEKKHTLLLVDDHPPNIYLLAEALIQDHEIVVATNGAQALEIASQEPRPDLILLDILMPGMDGYEVCSRLKGDPFTKMIPVIFITAKSGEEDETRGLGCGAVDYITKPFSMPIVRARVRTHLELKRHRDMLENLSNLDGLTGIPNRRMFETHLDRSWRLGLREKAVVSVILADIDHFKAYNDSQGHLAGDECLRRVARILGSQVRRPMDLVARYGGEEFIGVLYGGSPEGVVTVAEAMRTAVERAAIPHRSSPVANHVTVSLGVASLVPLRDGSPTALVGAADQALYCGKESGRNTLRVFDFTAGRPRGEESTRGSVATVEG